MEPRGRLSSGSKVNKERFSFDGDMCDDFSIGKPSEPVYDIPPFETERVKACRQISSDANDERISKEGVTKSDCKTVCQSVRREDGKEKSSEKSPDWMDESLRYCRRDQGTADVQPSTITNETGSENKENDGVCSQFFRIPLNWIVELILIVLSC